ncbi:MAG: class I SAM-dependent methyltransferase [Gemmatimonadota bacterium]|nr:class I SAM-dependent methyltransferase [Gemmatimonadota bacterium]
MGDVNKITPELAAYIRRVGVREPAAAARCRRETERDLPDRARMLTVPEQGAFLAMLVRLLDAERALEVGVFTGYSALWIAGALAPGGRLTACDISEEYTDRARVYWDEAGVSDRIDLRLAPALETLDALLVEGAAGSYDLAFIDADKAGYDDYYERSLELLRPGGVVSLDNTLWDGRVIDPSDRSDDTEAIRAMNEKIVADPRVDMVLTTVGDGLTVCRKRGP